MNTNRTEKAVKVVLIILAVYIVLSVMLGTAFGAKDPAGWWAAFGFTAIWYGFLGFLIWKYRD